MKVALVSDCFWPRINGVTISIQTFRDELERQGHQTLVLAPAYPNANADPELPRVRRFRSTRNFLSKEDRDVLPDAFPEIFAALDEFSPDIVHFNTEFGMFLAGSLWCKLHHKPVFITCHTNWEFYIKHYAPLLPSMFARAIARHYMLRAYSNADYILMPGSQMQDLLFSYGVCGPFHVLQTGIDSAGFRSNPEELDAFRQLLDAEAPWLAGKRLLLYVGRLGNEKNISFLLPVLALVRESVPETVLVLIGDGPYRKKILKEAKKQGLGLHGPQGPAPGLRLCRRVRLSVKDRDPGSDYHRGHDVRLPRGGHRRDGHPRCDAGGPRWLHGSRRHPGLRRRSDQAAFRRNPARRKVGRSPRMGHTIRRYGNDQATGRTLRGLHQGGSWLCIVNT